MDQNRVLLVGSCEHGTEISGSIKGREFIDWLSNYQLLQKDSAPWSLLFSKLLEACCMNTRLCCCYGIVSRNQLTIYSLENPMWCKNQFFVLLLFKSQKPDAAF
jgi:hypothetical protein